MESGAESEHRSPLLAELALALQLVNQLESHLAQSSLAELVKPSASEIASAIRKSILMAQSTNPVANLQAAAAGSPPSFTDSPRSENSSLSFGEHGLKETLKKKRKTQHKWTRQVRLTPGSSGVEGPVDDGYSWRKYGQKDILGAHHPRAYYRCTHRMTQGCLATKQVQRSDNDPLLFNVTYHGTHSCLQRAQQHKPANSLAVNEKLLSFQTELKVKIEDLDSEEGDHKQFSSLSFAPMEAMNEATTAEIFHSPNFVSPINSESAYFSPYQIESFDGGVKLNSSDSDLTEIISRANSASNSSLVDMDFKLDDLTESAYFSPYQVESFDGGVKLHGSDSDLTEIISRANSASNSSLVDMDFKLDDLDFDQAFEFDASAFF